MWNFTGRQNDIAGTYDILKGNWISGIPFIDNMRLGNQSKISEDAKNNKARNTYFFLPFIVGTDGAHFCISARFQAFLGVVAFLFVYGVWP